MSLSIRALMLVLVAGCADEKDTPTDADGDGFWSDVDCDDGDASLYPAADEVCDGVDNDCDGEIDELAADAHTWSLDSDGDGYGEPSYTVSACAQPDGYAPSSGDCDDTRDTVFPGAVEACDGVDNDCDGLLDDADPDLDTSTVTTWYRDVDGDGHGDGALAGLVACSDPSTSYAAYVDSADDCDDSDASAAPGLDEVCGDGVDNDCDGSDEGCGREGEIGTDAARARLIGGAGARAGGALAAVDTDGDGLDDAIVGAPGASAVYLFMAPLAGTVSAGAAEASLLDGDGDGGLGGAVAGADLDGDGYGDLISGLPGASAVAWLAGPVRGALPALPGDGAARGGEGAGASLAMAGDALGEDSLAVLVGAPDADGGAGEGSGVVYVLAAPWGADAALEDAPTLLGSSGGEGAGATLCAAGDVDGDGVEDVLIGAPEAGGGAGLVTLTLGPVSGATISDDADARWTGPAEGDRLGAGLAGVGDVDNDGDDDLLLGAPEVAEPEAQSGAAWLLSGGEGLAADLDGAAAHLSGAAGARLGASAASAGRFDDDRRADLVVGAPGVEAAWVLFGAVEGALDLADAELLLRGEAGDALGSTLASGLLDGDGQTDLLVAGTGAGLGGVDAGAVWLLTGSGW